MSYLRSFEIKGCDGPSLGGENLGGDDEGGGVGAPVGEEEAERVERDEGALLGLEVVVVTGQDAHEQRHHEEAADLDPPPPDDVHREDSEVVPGDGRPESDQSLREKRRKD